MKKKSVAASSRPEKLVVKSESDIRRYLKSDKYKADLAHLKPHSAKHGGAPSAADLEEIPELTDAELASMRRAVPKKLSITARLDADVIQWLKKGGGRYQTRMNGILRTVMEKANRKTSA